VLTESAPTHEREVHTECRLLRQRSTEAEKILWRLLRARQFFGLKFRRQYPVGPNIVDFYCAACGIAIELDGGQHFEANAQSYDQRRTTYLSANGVRVLRFTNREAFQEIDGVLEVLRRECKTAERFLGPRRFSTKLAVEVLSMSSPADRRSEARFAVAVAVTMESEHNFYTGLTSDLSGGGLFVATHQIRPVGERIHLRFTLPTTRDPIDALTEVRWVRAAAVPGGGGEAGMGLQFLQLAPQAKEAIKAFLKKRDSLFFDVD
jgi:uncharacterized protein (TIGR02266 family)